MEYILREFRIGDPRDAELLAAMWNASDAGWPGGLTGGIPETAERILERTRKLDRIAIFVVEVNGEIVGYGDMEPVRGRDGVVYLDLLNVRPDFHGKGLGKALVLKVLERAVERGGKQLTIGTWAGNKKSVPLYKKTGFFWVPETSVWMQNYIPTALDMPIARPFFAKHYWYSCFKRELEIVPDDIEWNGIKVYPYRFEKDGDVFAMWIDKQAEAPTAVETNDLYAACIVGKENVVCGLEQKVRWEIVSKKAAEETLQVALMADGAEGIGLSLVENSHVADRVVIEKSFTVSPDITLREPGMPAHQIKSTLLVNGVPLTFGTAVKPVQPVDIQFSTKMVVSGKPNEKVLVKLKSNLDFPVHGELLIDPHPSLCFDRLSASFTLEPESWTSCTFYLQVHGTGAFVTKMRAVCPPDLNSDFIPADSPLTTRSKSVAFLTRPLDSVYTWYNEEDKAITVESPTMWVRIDLRGGNVSIHERSSGRRLCQHRAPSLGPPFIGWQNVPPTYAHRLEQKDGKASVTLIMPSDSAPGMTVEKTITVGAGSFVRIDHRIFNTADTAQKFKLRCGAQSELHGKITLPLKDGLIHEPFGGWGGFPMEERDVSEKPEDYAESWFAAEDSGLVTGMVWGECEEREGVTLQIDLPEMPPQSHYDLEPFYLVAARGNWEVVRQLWRWLQQPSTVREDRKPIAHPVLKANFEPAPLLITRSESNAKLAVHNRRGKALDGKWQIQDCGLWAQPADGELTDVKRGSPFVQEIAVTAADLTPRVETAQVMLSEEVTTHKFISPAIILGNVNQPVNFSSESTDDKPWTISVDNGYFSFTAAPTFLGSVTALERGGINHLKSTYPKAGPYLWMNPWFGGIHPFLGWLENQRFVKEQFTGEQVERTGKRGIVWHGVKVASDIQHKDDRWLRIEFEYLTLGGSNVLAIVQRLINKTNAPQGIHAGVSLWLAVGGGTANNVIHYTQNRPRYEQAASTDEQIRVLRHRRLSEYGFEVPSRRWMAVENPQTGDVLTLIVSCPNTGIDADTAGKDTASLLWAAGEMALEPEEMKETVLWLVIGNSVAEAQEYQALGEVWELP